MLSIRNLNLIVDIDDTIILTSKVMYEIYCNKHNIKPNYRPHGWGFSGMNEIQGITQEEISEILCSDEFYSRIELMPYVKIVLEKLRDKGHKIIFCSKHQPFRTPKTYQFLKDNGLNVDKGFDYCFLSTFDKGSIVGNGDFNNTVIIDDKIECLQSFEGKARWRICFGENLWSKNWLGIRLSNWLLVDEFIDRIEKIKGVNEIC